MVKGNMTYTPILPGRCFQHSIREGKKWLNTDRVKGIMIHAVSLCIYVFHSLPNTLTVYCYLIKNARRKLLSKKKQDLQSIAAAPLIPRMSLHESLNLCVSAL